MSNSIENVLEMLTSNPQTANGLSNLIKSISEVNDGKGQNVTATQTTKDTDKLQLKINLINAMIPLLGSKEAEQAQFIIKLLSVISVIRRLKNGEN